MRGEIRNGGSCACHWGDRLNVLNAGTFDAEPRNFSMNASNRPGVTTAPGACRVTWARGARAVVQFGVDAALLCPVLGQAMWRMGR